MARLLLALILLIFQVVSPSLPPLLNYFDANPRNMLVFHLCMCAKSLSHVRLFVSPWTVARQAALSTGIPQTRILGWISMPSSQPRDRTGISCVSCIGKQLLCH